MNRRLPAELVPLAIAHELYHHLEAIGEIAVVRGRGAREAAADAFSLDAAGSDRMSEYFAGIDGGQSSTVAIVGDERGKILGRATAGPADEVGAGAGSTRLRDALGEALAGACRAAALPYEGAIAAVVAGVSGYEGRVYGEPPRLAAQRLVILHDAPIAHAGALGGPSRRRCHCGNRIGGLRAR